MATHIDAEDPSDDADVVAARKHPSLSWMALRMGQHGRGGDAGIKLRVARDDALPQAAFPDGGDGEGETMWLLVARAGPLQFLRIDAHTFDIAPGNYQLLVRESSGDFIRLPLRADDDADEEGEEEKAREVQDVAHVRVDTSTDNGEDDLRISLVFTHSGMATSLSFVDTTESHVGPTRARVRIVDDAYVRRAIVAASDALGLRRATVELSSSALGVVDLFCGCGGASIAASLAGLPVVAAADYNRVKQTHYKVNNTAPVFASPLEEANDDALIDFILKGKAQTLAAPQGAALHIHGSPSCVDFSPSTRHASAVDSGKKSEVTLTWFLNFVKRVMPLGSTGGDDKISKLNVVSWSIEDAPLPRVGVERFAAFSKRPRFRGDVRAAAAWIERLRADAALRERLSAEGSADLKAVASGGKSMRYAAHIAAMPMRIFDSAGSDLSAELGLLDAFADDEVRGQVIIDVRMNAMGIATSRTRLYGGGGLWWRAHNRYQLGADVAEELGRMTLGDEAVGDRVVADSDDASMRRMMQLALGGRLWRRAQREGITHMHSDQGGAHTWFRVARAAPDEDDEEREQLWSWTNARRYMGATTLDLLPSSSATASNRDPDVTETDEEVAGRAGARGATADPATVQLDGGKSVRFGKALNRESIRPDDATCALPAHLKDRGLKLPFGIVVRAARKREDESALWRRALGALGSRSALRALLADGTLRVPTDKDFGGANRMHPLCDSMPSLSAEYASYWVAVDRDARAGRVLERSELLNWSIGDALSSDARLRHARVNMRFVRMMTFAELKLFMSFPQDFRGLCSTTGGIDSAASAARRTLLRRHYRAARRRRERREVAVDTDGGELFARDVKRVGDNCEADLFTVTVASNADVFCAGDAVCPAGLGVGLVRVRRAFVDAQREAAAVPLSGGQVVVVPVTASTLSAESKGVLAVEDAMERTHLPEGTALALSAVGMSWRARRHINMSVFDRFEEFMARAAAQANGRPSAGTRAAYLRELKAFASRAEFATKSLLGPDLLRAVTATRNRRRRRTKSGEAAYGGTNMGAVATYWRAFVQQEFWRGGGDCAAFREVFGLTDTDSRGCKILARAARVLREPTSPERTRVLGLADGILRRAWPRARARDRMTMLLHIADNDEMLGKCCE